MRKPGNWSVSLKLTVLYSILILIVSSSLSLSLYRQLHNAGRQAIQERLRDILRFSAPLVDGDYHSLIRSPEDERSPFYEVVAQRLESIRATSDVIEQIYTLRQQQDGSLVYVVDISLTNPAGVGKVYPDNNPLLQNRLYAQGPVVEDTLHTRNGENHLAGYAPIYNQFDEPDGMLVIDINAAAVIASETQARRITLLAFLATVPPSLLLGWILARRLTFPLTDLVQGAERVAHGDLTQNVPVRNRDEIGALAMAFNTMTEKLRQTLDGLNRHVTELTRTQAALKESEQTLETVVNSITDYVWSADVVDGQVIYRYYSPVVEQITGYPPEYFMTGIEAWFNIIHTEDREMVEAEVAEELKEKITEHEYRIIDAKGEIKWLHSTTSPTANNSGEVIRLNGVVSDITRRKQLSEQLRQAQKMEAIGKLAGGIAHDFNNLLTAILGHSDLALRHLHKDNPLWKNISQIKKAAERAALLTNQLLAFSRKQVLQPKVINLNSRIIEIEALLKTLAGETIHLVSRLAPDLDPIKVDPSQLEQVIINLIVNARDAMPNGGTITIETTNIRINESEARLNVNLEPGSYIMLSVTDTGHGINEEIRKHIFDPFFTTKEPGKGTGMGLATVHGIVAQSGGHIDVFSRPEQGATFKIYLPHIKEDPLPTEVEDIPTHSPLSVPHTILLVEDEESVRTLAREILRMEGYNILEAANGHQALHLSRQYLKPIQLLLTDIVMPDGMSGIQLAEKLKPQRPKMKILFMSGYTDKDMLHHTGAEATPEFLQKPFTLTKLVNAVHHVLNQVDET